MQRYYNNGSKYAINTKIILFTLLFNALNWHIFPKNTDKEAIIKILMVYMIDFY